MKVFVEEQKVKQIWIYAILGVVFVKNIIDLIKMWNQISHENIFEKLKQFTGIAIIILVTLFFLGIKLKTKINEEGILYQFYPFHWIYKSITWNLIETISIRQYNAITEYGGWGIKFGFFTGRGMALTTSGNIGLQLVLKNGKKLLIGTHKKEHLQQVLETYQYKLS